MCVLIVLTIILGLTGTISLAEFFIDAKTEGVRGAFSSLAYAICAYIIVIFDILTILGKV